MTTRKEGFYRVRKGDQWLIGYWRNDNWELCGSPVQYRLRDSAFSDIQPTPLNPKPLTAWELIAIALQHSDTKEIKQALWAGYNTQFIILSSPSS